MKKWIKLFDCGMIPYKGYYRRLLYRLFPGSIKYERKGVELEGLSVIRSSPNSSYTLCEVTGGKVIGNVYRVTEEVLEYIKKTIHFLIISVVINDEFLLAFKGYAGVNLPSEAIITTSIKESETKYPRTDTLKFMYETSNKVKTSKL